MYSVVVLLSMAVVSIYGFEEILSLFYSSSCVSHFLAKAWMHSCVGPAKFMFSRVKLGCFIRGSEKYVNLTTDSPLHSTIGRYRRDFLFHSFKFLSITCCVRFANGLWHR